MDYENYNLLTEINRFLKETGMSPTVFGVKAARNSHLVERLRRGADVRTGTAAKIRAFIEAARKTSEAAE